MTILKINSREDLKLLSSSPASSSSSSSVYDEIVMSLDITRIVINDESDTIGSLFSALKPSGKLTIEGKTTIDEVEKKNMFLDLQLAGYLINENIEDGDDKKIEASKPDWNLGVSTAVKIDKPVNSVWSMDAADEDEELVDENELFNDNIEVKKVSGCDGEDAEPGSRRACKNCSCGLKEEEDAAIEAGIKLDPSDVKSACGNCSKGDAFRCAGCPSRGKPAWNVDDNSNKVMLNMDDDI